MSKPKTETAGLSPPNITPEVEALASYRRAILFLTLGRGNRGKTMFTRFMAQRAVEAGRPPILADADRTNASLTRFFPNALSPTSADDAAVTALFSQIVEEQAATGRNAAIDLGAGDVVLKRAAREMALTAWLPTIGIDPVAVHVVGPSADDLSVLQATENGGLFTPERTIIILNEATVPHGEDPEEAFNASVRDNPILLATVKRGARVISMPRLAPAEIIATRRLTFTQAASNVAPPGVEPLGLWKAQQAAMWVSAMERQIQDAEIGGWLL